MKQKRTGNCFHTGMKMLMHVMAVWMAARVVQIDADINLMSIPKKPEILESLPSINEHLKLKDFYIYLSG